MNRLGNIFSNAAFIIAAFAVLDEGWFRVASLIAIGLFSAWYHWRPSLWSLAADRWGMLLVFSALLMPEPGWAAALVVVLVSAYVAHSGAAASPTVMVLGAIVIATRDSLVIALLATALFAWGYYLWRQQPETEWWKIKGKPMHSFLHVTSAIAFAIL